MVTAPTALGSADARDDDVAMSEDELPATVRYHVWLVRDYATRHFTDRAATLAEAAVFGGLTDRTLRKSLAAADTSWRAIVLELRMQRARHLLEATGCKLEHVARMSGYSTAAALTAAFNRHERRTPSAYRKSRGGRRRAGRSRSREAREAALAAARAAGTIPEGVRGGPADVRHVIRNEIRERLEDRHFLQDGFPRAEEEEIDWCLQTRLPRLTEDPECWRKLRRAVDASIEENNRRLAPSAAADSTRPREGRA
jgi:AraC-like DNA-binding protein